MIAGIDYQGNIEAFLNKEEIENLPNSILEGVIIQTNKPKRQGIIRISVNEAKKKDNGWGIGLNDEKYWKLKDNFELELFLGYRYYEQLKKAGFVGETQYMLVASRIDIYDKSRMCVSNIFKIKDLEYYRDNRNELPEHRD